MEPQADSSSKFLILAIVILLVALACMVFIVRDRGVKGGEIEVKMAKAAEEGELIEGFPRELIIMADAKIIKSEDISGIVQGKGTEIHALRLTYRTEVDAVKLQGAYTELARSRGYRIMDSGVSERGNRKLVFNRPDDIVALEIAQVSPTTSEVTISVTQKP